MRHLRVMTRREFLHSIAGVGAAVPYVTVGVRLLAYTCRCGASITAPSAPAFDTTQIYCPNCGRSLRSGAFRLRRTGWIPATGDPAALPVWEVAQVPFPNPRLVHATTKPRVSMSSVMV